MSDDACRVLIVKDSPHILHLPVEYLSAEGFDVRAAVNGRQALAVLERWQPDLIVLDLAMPVMDGWTFRATQLRIEEVAEIPVLIFSANFDQRAQIEALKASAVLPTGCDLDELADTVRRIVPGPAVADRAVSG